MTLSSSSSFSNTIIFRIFVFYLRIGYGDHLSIVVSKEAALAIMDTA
jgi:hypothetical protein